MKWGWRRVLAILAAAVVAVVAAILLVVHLPPVRSRVFDLAVAELESRFDLDLRARSFTYNVITRRVTLRGARLGARAANVPPFLEADLVEVRLPWSIFTGDVTIANLTVADGRVTLVRGADGELNLPPGSDDDEPVSDTPARLDIRGLDLRNIDVTYDAGAAGLAVQLTGIRAALDYELIRVFEGVSGTFGVDGGVRVTLDDRTLSAAPIDARLAFDGSNVSFQDLVLRTDEAMLDIDGRVLRVLDAPAFDLQIEGTADLARAVEWAPELPVGISGPLTVTGTLTDPVAAFVLALDVASDEITVGLENGLAINGSVRLTPDVVSAEGVTLRPASGGAVDVSLQQTLGEAGSSTYQADWSALDARVLYRLAGEAPGPIGARLEGHAAAEVSAATSALIGADVSNRSTPIRAAGLVPLDGTLEATVADGRWSAEHDHRAGRTAVRGRANGAFDSEAPMASTLGGTATVNIGDLGEAARTAGLAGVEVPEIVAEGQGPVAAQLTMAGRFDDPRVSGRVSGEGITLDAIGDDIRLATDVEASSSAVTLANLEVDVSSAQLRGDVAVRLDREALSGSLRLDAPEAAELQGAVPEEYRLQGPLQATASLGGTPSSPLIDVTLNGMGLMLADQPVSSLSAEARVAGDEISVTSLEVTQGEGGTLTGTAEYAWESGRYDVDLSGDGLTWSGPVGGGGVTRAVVGLTFAGTGTIDEPHGEGEVRFELTGGTAGELIQRGTADIDIDGSIARVMARVPLLGALAHGTVSTQAPYAYDAVAVLNRLDLAPVAQLAGAPAGEVTGGLSLSAALRGTIENAAADSVAFINLQDLNALVGGVPVTLAAPARFAWRPSGLGVDELDLGVGSGRLTAGGALLSDNGDVLEARFDGELADLGRAARAFGGPEVLDMGGRLALTWESTGEIETANASIQVEDGRIVWGDLPPVEQLAVEARFDGAALEVTTLTGQWQDGGLDGSATIPRAILTGEQTAATATSGRATLRVSGLTDAALAPWLDEEARERITGRVSATLEADITGARLEDVAATVVFDEADFVLAGVETSQAQPVRISLDNGLLTLDEVTWNVGGSPIALTGAVGLGGEGPPVLDLEADGRVDLRIVSAFVSDIATGGNAVLDVRVGGTTEAPEIDGRIELEAAELALQEPRVLLSDVGGVITLAGQSIGFAGVTGSANGGRLTLDGRLELDGGTVSGGQLITELRRVALEYPDGLRSEIDALLMLTPEDPGWLLTGDVRVQRSSYRENLSLAALVAANRTQTTTIGERSALEDVRLNILVVTVQNALVDNNYGRFEGTAAVRVVGTAANPGLTGRLTLQEGGQVYLAGRTLQIERGAISFVDPNGVQPDLDLELRTRASGHDLVLSLSGTPEELTVSARSETDPRLPEGEVYGILLGTSGGLSGAQAATLLSAEILGSTGRAIGLDTLRIERGFSQANVRADPGAFADQDDPSTRLTLSKRIQPDVLLTLSQSLQDSGALSAILSYRPWRNVELRAITRDDSDRTFDARHELTFGGGSTGPIVANADADVSAIDFTGNLGRPEAELADALSLRAGDTFNFYDWQSDTDRLRQMYWEAGYFEAQVRPTRTEDAGTVRLEYAVERGPRTEVAVSGYDAPADLIGELHDAWTRTLFDQFLLTDMEDRIARHLITQNVIGSTVTAAVESATAEHKVIHVTVEPGTSVGGREMRFSGNQRVATSRLETEVQRAGLGAEAWLAPDEIGEALLAFYQSIGYLDAGVSVAQPQVEGTEGILPITIDEGALYTLSEIALAGVAEPREPSMREAAGLVAGAPYEAASREQAARRIELRYHESGFNDARVTVQSGVDQSAATVRLTFDVTEGPQQVLQEITTSGASLTRDGVIATALSLETGAPVNPTEWAQARKRLYDTNVFRQVDIEVQPLTPGPDTPDGVQPVRAVVRVEEYPQWRFTYGLQLNDEREDLGQETTRTQSLGVTGELQNQNLMGRAIAAGISGRYERDRWTARTFIQTPTFFRMPAATTFYGQIENDDLRVDDLVQFVTEVRSVTVEQRWRPGAGGLQLSYGYSFEQNHTFDPAPSPGDPFPLDSRANIARVNAAFLADRRNDPFNTTDGWFFSATWAQAAEALGSDYRNSRLVLQQYYFQEVGPVVLASRASYGGSFWAQSTLFPSERFYTGGATTVRGYGENSLGPRDFLGQAEGGKSLLLLNQEIRFPMFWWFEGVGFVDAGNVFEETGQVSFGDLKVGYGLGLRINTPFALVRVDFGIPGSEIPIGTDRGANLFSSGRWYIGLGHIF